MRRHVLAMVVAGSLLVAVAVPALAPGNDGGEPFVVVDRVGEPYVGLEHPWAKIALNCGPIDIVELRFEPLPAEDLVGMTIQVEDLVSGCPVGDPGGVPPDGWELRMFTLYFDHPWWDESYIDIGIMERPDGPWFWADLTLWYGAQLLTAGLYRDFDRDAGEIWVGIPTGLVPPPWTDVSLVSWIHGCAGVNPCLGWAVPAFADRAPDVGTFDYGTKDGEA